MKQYVYPKSHDTVFEITSIQIKYIEFSEDITASILGFVYNTRNPSTVTLHAKNLSELQKYIKPLSHWQGKYPELFI